MQEKNALNKYKEILGQYCAINQFVELAKRCFVAEHKEEISNREAFVNLANQNAITLTDYDSTRMVSLISKSYIVNIHLCFETFLKELLSLIRKYGNKTFVEKIPEDSWLKCTIKNIFPAGLPEELHMLVDLCEYYRLIRNSSVHDLFDVDEHTKEFRRLSRYTFNTAAKFEKLSAPNQFDDISFDDFVMFSRSSLELAQHLFDNMSYDYDKIISDIPVALKQKWKKFNRTRRERAILAYINANFKTDASIEKLLPLLANKYAAQ